MKWYLIFSSSSLSLKRSSLISNRMNHRGTTAFLSRLIEWSWQQKQQLGGERPVEGEGSRQGNVTPCLSFWFLGKCSWQKHDWKVRKWWGETIYFSGHLRDAWWWLSLDIELSLWLYRFFLSQPEDHLSPAMSERVPMQRAAAWNYSHSLINGNSVAKIWFETRTKYLLKRWISHSNAKRIFACLRLCWKTATSFTSACTSVAFPIFKVKVNIIKNILTANPSAWVEIEHRLS